MKRTKMRIVEGTVVVVTGGGSGIGAALVRACLVRGCTVVALDKNADRLVDLERAAGEGNLVTEVADVSDLTVLCTVAQKITQRLGRVDVLINNAGVASAAPFQTSDPDDFRWVIEANLWGVVNGCHAFLPLLLTSRGQIVNILSVFALIGFPTKAAYCTSKFAARGFSEALRADLAASGVGVTTAFVGPVDTNLIRDSRTWSEASRKKEVAFLASRGLPVDRVTRLILRGIERNRNRVFVGGVTWIADVASRLAPNWVNSVLARWQHRIPFLGA